MTQQAQTLLTVGKSLPQTSGYRQSGDSRIKERPLQGPSIHDFTIYLQYIAEHFSAGPDADTIDSTGLWDTYEGSSYSHRPDLNPVILLESLRRRRAALGSFPLLRAKDLIRIRESYHREAIAA